MSDYRPPRQSTSSLIAECLAGAALAIVVIALSAACVIIGMGLA